MLDTQPFIHVDEDARTIELCDEWNIHSLSTLQNTLKDLRGSVGGLWTVRGDHIKALDTGGAWLLDTLLTHWKQQGRDIHLAGFSDAHLKLLKMVQKNAPRSGSVKPKKALSSVAILGKRVCLQWHEAYRYLNFIGKLTLDGLAILAHWSRIRFREIAGIIESTGYRALPIITLLSAMIGVVISYQMGNQLRNYGANVFIVDLLGLSVLREFGPLLTAIIVAGRTGSAFTAQLGIMEINQEMDALNTMGVTPNELLIFPRVLALFLVMPLLTMWADVFGIIGGMAMANNMLGVTWYEFLHRFQQAIPLRNLLIGLGKAPVFALIISSIACFQGMSVSGSAASVGDRTTRSVVVSIFAIIMADAIFSVLFSKFNL